MKSYMFEVNYQKVEGGVVKTYSDHIVAETPNAVWEYARDNLLSTPNDFRGMEVLFEVTAILKK